MQRSHEANKNCGGCFFLLEMAVCALRFRGGGEMARSVAEAGRLALGRAGDISLWCLANAVVLG